MSRHSRARALRVLLATVAILALLGGAPAYAGTVSGVAREGNSSATGVQGVTVTALEPGTQTPLASTTTGLGGGYELAVPDGTYDLRFVPPFGAEYGPVVDPGESVAGAAEVNLSFLNPHMSSGLTGVLRDSAGDPISGATVSLNSREREATATTAADGAFALAAPDGRYSVSFHFSVAGVSGEQIYDASTPETLVITGVRRQDLTAPLYVTTLHLRDQRGSNVPNVSAYWFSECEVEVAPGLRGVMQAYVNETAVASASGELRLAHPACSGSTNVTLMPQPNAGLGRASQPVATGPGDRSQTVTLDDAAHFSGVVATPSGLRLSGVKMTLQNSETSIEARTSSDGSFSVSAQPGSYSVRLDGGRTPTEPATAVPDHFMFEAQGLQVADGGHVTLKLPLRPFALTVEGEGAPIPEAAVTMYEQTEGHGGLGAGTVIRQASVNSIGGTGADGTATIPLIDGQATGRVSSAAGWTNAFFATGDVVKEPTKSVTLSRSPTEDVTLSGELDDRHGTPLAGITLVAIKGEYGHPGYVEVEAATSPNGRFALTVPKGTYNVYLSHCCGSNGAMPAWFRAETTPVAIQADREVELVLPFTKVRVFSDVGGGTSQTVESEECESLGNRSIGSGLAAWFEFEPERTLDEGDGADLYGVAGTHCSEIRLETTPPSQPSGSESLMEEIELPLNFGPEDETKHLELGASAVSGTVLGPDGAPVSNAHFEASPLRFGRQELVTDQNGHFKLVLPNGTSELAIKEEAHGAAAAGAQPSGFAFFASLDVAGSAEQNISIPGRKVSVHAYDSSGNALHGVGLAAVPLSDGVYWPLSGSQAPDVEERRLLMNPAGTTESQGTAAMTVPPATSEPEFAVLDGAAPAYFAMQPGDGPSTELIEYPRRVSEPPSVSSVAVSGSTSYGVGLDVKGLNLSEVTAAHCGADPAFALTEQGEDALSVDCPNGTGTTHLTVTNAAGTSAETPADEFEYPQANLPPKVKCSGVGEGWHPDDVTVSCTASDGFTGLAHPEDASFTLSTAVAAGEQTATAYTGSRKVCNNAGNCTEAGPVGPILIDRKPPSVTVKDPSDGLLVLEGSGATAQYSCADSGSGVASCEGSIPNGAPLDNAPGEHTLAVSSVDHAGNESSRVIHYRVVEAGGCESALCQRGAGDVAPPELEMLEAAPVSIDTSGGPRSVTVTMHVTDDLSGVAAVEVGLTGGTQPLWAQATRQPGGTALDGGWVATLTLPQGSRTGTYALSASMIDNRGNQRALSSEDLASKGLPASITQTGSETPPVSPPQVAGVTATPESVETCAAPRSITVTAEASENQVGVAALRAILIGPHGEGTSANALLQSGSANAGIWEATLTLPRFAAEGTWALAIQARDRSGGESYLSSAQLSSRGFASTVQQTCPGDLTPPSVSAVAIQPSSIDTSAQSRSVAIEAQVSDDLSGVAGVEAALSSGGQHTIGRAVLSSGTALNGLWITTLKLPQYSRQGAWLLSLTARDAIGNQATLGPSALSEAGLTNSLAQQGLGDEQAPAIAGGSVLPTRINTEHGPQQVQVRIHAQDPLSGTSQVSVNFVSLHGQTVFGLAALEEGGTPQDGTWRANLAFPQYSEQGGWELRIETRDGFGNTHIYGPSELNEIIPELHDGPPRPPQVSSVGPTFGKGEGGSEVTISGGEMEEVTDVRFGASGALSYHVTSPTSITAIAPPGQGTVDVRVTNAGGRSAVSERDRFTYVAHGDAPTVKKLSPKKGETSGGAVTKVTGTGFIGVTAVTVGGAPAQSFNVLSEGLLEAVVPSGPAGAADLIVTTPNGNSAVNPKDRYTYGAPIVFAVGPASGPKTGGTEVTVTGSGFALGAATTFVFGKEVGTNVACASTSSCTVVTPAAAKAGTVDMRVQVGKSKSKKSAADRFTYQ